MTIEERDALLEIEKKLAAIESLLQRLPEIQAVVLFQMYDEYQTAKMQGKKHLMFGLFLRPIRGESNNSLMYCIHQFYHKGAFIMRIETLTAAEATEVLRGLGVKITPVVLRDGLLDRRYPFGECFQTGNGSIKCTIYKRLLDAWITERATDLPDAV